MSIPTPIRTLLAVVSLVLGMIGMVGALTTAETAAAPPSGNCHHHRGICPTSPATTPTTPPTTLPTTPTTPTKPPTTIPTGGGTYSCSVPIGGNCGPYSYSGIPMSNGYNTYVSNQAINVHGTETVFAKNPGDWKVVPNLSDCGGCVQVYPDAQQLTNNWCGTGWGGCANPTDTPWRQFSTIKVTYAETSPQTGASYQFSPDLWGPGPWDIMFWVDTHGRCNEGAFGPTLLGHYTADGQGWTAHAYGDEIILVLDGPGGQGTCAQQSSGTINIKAGLDWLWNNGHIRGTTISQFNTGWEITQSSGQTFQMTNYSITMN